MAGEVADCQQGMGWNDPCEQFSLWFRLFPCTLGHSHQPGQQGQPRPRNQASQKQPTRQVLVNFFEQAIHVLVVGCTRVSTRLV